MENDQSTQFQDSVFRTVLVIFSVLYKEVAIFILLPSWESEAGFYLAQKNLWCNFSENTIGECLIHIVMMRPHKVSHAAGLSFNLNVEKCCYRRQILAAGCWYMWACEKSFCQRPVSTKKTEAEITFIWIKVRPLCPLCEKGKEQDFSCIEILVVIW